MPPGEKVITFTYFDSKDQAKEVTWKGARTGFDVLSPTLVKIWSDRETLILPTHRLISIHMET